MSFSAADATIVAEQIDRLVTTEIGGKYRTQTHAPLMRALYEAARGSGDPLSYAIAKTLARVCQPGKHVLITTGFMLDNYMQGESDGPPGAATLARTLERAFGVKPVLLTERAHREIVTAALRAIGLREFGLREAMEYPRRFSILDLPLELEAARREAKGLFDELQIAAVIALEKPGANRLGVYHSSRGRDISRHCGKIEPYLDEAKARGIPTIAIVDLGNEAGAGGLAAAADVIPNATKCLCPCGGGVLASSVVDHVFPAFTSNWGAYSIAAMLAFTLDKPALFEDAKLARDVLRECGRAGAASSTEGYSGSMVDRIPEEIHVNVIELLHYIIASAREELLGTNNY